MEDQNNRFKDLPWFEQTKSTGVILAGCGGIGSWLAYLLIKSNISSLIVYDPDTVSNHNLGGQLLYNNEATISENKIDSILNVLKNTSTSSFARDLYVRVKPHRTRINSTKLSDSVKVLKQQNFCNKIIIASAVDNMETRRELSRTCLELFEEDIQLMFIDGRLLAEDFQIYTALTQSQTSRYITETLFDDSLVEEGPCSARQTAFASAMIASRMCSFILNFISDDPMKSIPFSYKENIPMNLVQTLNHVS